MSNVKIRYGRALGQRIFIKHGRKITKKQAYTIENSYLPSIGYRNKKE